MKLIINIDERTYCCMKEIPEDSMFGIQCDKNVRKAIIDGIPLPKEFDVIKNDILLEQIRAEIEKVFCMSVVTNELRTPMEVKTEILQIIDNYKGDKE